MHAEGKTKELTACLAESLPLAQALYSQIEPDQPENTLAAKLLLERACLLAVAAPDQATPLPENGPFDAFVDGGAALFHPEDRPGFMAAFSRESLLAAHARGETSVHFEGRQQSDSGAYVRVSTDVIFVPSDDGEVHEITLSRAFDNPAPAQEEEGKR